MYEITVDDHKEEKNTRAHIIINPNYYCPEHFYADEKDITFMNGALRFIDIDGDEYIYSGIPYKIKFEEE